MTVQMPTGSALRKAAIVLMALDQDVASLVMGRLDSDAMAAVTRELAQLGAVPAQVRREVLREFYQQVTVQPVAEPLDANQPRAAGEAGFRSSPPGLADLGQVDSAALWAAIRGEHPQTIALIVSELAGPRADALLAQMPEDLQDDVVRRVATMRPAHPDVLTEVAQVVGARLGGAASLPVNPSSSSAPAVKASMAFEDLPQVPDRRLREALQQVTLEDLALALRTADQPVVRKVMRNLNRSAAAALKRQMAQQPPVRLSDIEAAGGRIMQAIDHAD